MVSIIAINGKNAFSIEECISSGSITEAVNAFSSFSFTLQPISSAYNLIQPFNTHIQVTEGVKELFFGRVLTSFPNMDSSGVCSFSVVCEDRMAYLCDSVQPYEEPKQYKGDENRNGIQEFIDLILENHNKQVEEYKKIYRGIVTVQTHESTEGVYKGLNYENTWECLKSKLIDVYGGEMRVRCDEGRLYLDYALFLGETRATPIEVGVNMQSASKKYDPTAVFSRLIPLGAKLTETKVDTEGNFFEKETEKRLTIESVNDGLIYVENETARELYGIQYTTVIWDDVHEAHILKRKAVEWLTAQNTVLASHDITAVDLSKLGIPADEIKLFDRYPVRNHYIGLNDTLEIIKKTTDIFSPYTPAVTLGNKNINLSDIANSTNNKLNTIEKELNTVKTETSNNINGLNLKIENIDGTYFYIRYSEYADGHIMSEIPDENTLYMGVCSTNKEEAPTDCREYIWSLIRGENGDDGISVNITSSAGSVFKNGVGETILSAHIYSGGEEITDTLDSSCFIWSRKSENEVSDAAWNAEHFGGSKEIKITGDDVDKHATFFCNIYQGGI